MTKKYQRACANGYRCDQIHFLMKELKNSWFIENNMRKEFGDIWFTFDQIVISLKFHKYGWIYREFLVLYHTLTEFSVIWSSKDCTAGPNENSIQEHNPKVNTSSCTLFKKIVNAIRTKNNTSWREIRKRGENVQASMLECVTVNVEIRS